MPDSTTARPDALTATRESWHRVAEHVVSAARYARTRHFTLVPRAGGFATPPLDAAGTVIAVEGDQLVVADSLGQRRAPLTTVGAAAAFVGVEPGFPRALYEPATPLEPEAPLFVDASSAQLLADWFALGADALRGFAAGIGDDPVSAAKLFPEHFDLGMTVGAVNFGFSPGDTYVPEPYAYVGPHQLPAPGSNPFWNAPFGAYRTHHEIRSVDDAVSFFTLGRRLAADPTHTRSTR